MSRKIGSEKVTRTFVPFTGMPAAPLMGSISTTRAGVKSGGGGGVSRRMIAIESIETGLLLSVTFRVFSP